MMKITTFDKPSIQTIRNELQMAIRDIECRYGIKLTAGRAKYSERSASITIDLATIDQNGNTVNHEREFLLANLTWLGLQTSHVDATIQIGNDSYRISGYKRARRAKPFSLISCSNGKNYVASEHTVRAALGLPSRIKGWSPRS